MHSQLLLNGKLLTESLMRLEQLQKVLVHWQEDYTADTSLVICSPSSLD